MKRLTSGVAVALTLMLASAPAAMAQEPATGGTSTGGTSTSTTPSDGTTTTTPGDGTSTTPGDGTAPTDGTSTPAAPSTGTPSATKTITLTKAQNKLVQRRIHVKADGALGAKTRTALKKYQSKRKLTKTGRPNLETIKAMKMPFAAAVEQKLSGKATGTDASTTTPAAGDMSAVIAAAQSVIGTPYASGGNDASGFDCSGLTVFAFKTAGITLPRTSFEQYKEGTAVQKADIQPGDLVFFSTAGAGASHVGIATSATTVISATTKGVMEHKIDDDYWGAAYVGARRITATDTTTAAARR
ncbi:C40 family peptidase [Patulibacter minatonensis]|uniref:C40 family peptidase n=1 Tax=Patulibacter minatonensis TaxID=298163 RepID=UPI00068784A0|nr:NlpC/P60 family protein [Patulibacter minatonensis]